MNIDKKLVSQFAGVLAVAMLFGTSAFAEDRHHDETNRSERREFHQRDGGQTRVQSGEVRSGETRSNEFHNNNHDRNNRQYDNNNQWRGSNEHRDYRNNDRRNDNRNYGRNDGYRYEHRNDHRNNDRYRGNYGYRGTPYRAHGRISRIERWNNGFRIWVGGALYPFFVPEIYYRSHNWRVGVDIALGGYYNPLGYYDYYDDAYYDGGSAVSAGAIRGVVETVDFRRGTFVLRDDISGNFVTVVMRGRDYDFGRLRPGDYVDVAGDWSRNGLFEAYRADLLDNGYYRR